MKIQKQWCGLANKYKVNTILKENLLFPYFLNLSLKGTILDVGCGSGAFSELIAEENNNVIAIDQEGSEFPSKGNVAYHKMLANNLSFKTKQFDNILLINVLSCVEDNIQKEILEECKRVKKHSGRIYCVNMSESVQYNLNTDLLKTKRINKSEVSLNFKQTDESYISFKDNLITESAFEELLQGLKLNIESKTYFKHKDTNIYTLYCLS